jgi:ABC-type branched-subunit amino acid transport system substrate-binding protein
MFSVLTPIRKSAGQWIAVLGTLILAACAPTSGPNTGGGNLDGAGVKVALLVPSGSGDASDEALAVSFQNAARLAMADLGGVAIDLKVYPTASSPAGAQEAARKAVEDGAQIILGPLRSEESNAAAVAVAGSGINVLSFSNNPSIAGGNLFVLGTTFQSIADRLSRYAVSNGTSRIMIVHDQSAGGEAGRAAIQSGVQAAGGMVVGTGGYEFSQNGIISAIPGLAATARDSGAQAVFLTAESAGALPLVSQLLRDNRLDPATVRFIGLSRWDVPPQTAALPSLQGGWFALPDPSRVQQFQSRYQAAYGQPPLPLAELAYDGIAAIGALASRGGGANLTASALTQGAGFEGVAGIFRLLPNGTNERGLSVAQIQNNQVTVIDPAPRSFGGFGF